MQPLPTSLKIVAYLFILGGICACIDVVAALFQSRISFNTAVAGLFVGRGLLRLHPRSLWWAKFSIAIGLVFTPIVAVLFLFTPGRLKFFRIDFGPAPPGLGFLLCLIVGALLVWQMRVLTRPRIRALFV